MNEQPEPRSPKGIASSIWAAPRIKPKTNNWNFRRKRERGVIAELSPKIKRLGFKSAEYKMGNFVGTLEDLKEYAAFRGLDYLQFGAVKYKTREVKC
jgi:hypothetical protein